MPVTLPAGEPAAGPWRVAPVQDLLRHVLDAAGRPSGRPAIVAVDGRGGAGKSTLAACLHRHAPLSAVVHTDDIAWHEPLFEWGHLLADDVLRPLRQGRALSYRPPQWQLRARAGAISVPAGLDVVLVEGTGASHREHADLVDATVWVQSDYVEAERRGIARDIEQGVNGDPHEAVAFWHEWAAAERVFFARQQPWRRACVVVNGTPSATLAADEVELADPPRASSAAHGAGGSPSTISRAR